MMKRAILEGFLLLSFGFSILAADPPSANISNGTVRAKLWLPDAQNGYYQGTRFDWSGSVASLETNGHSYFGVWFPRYDPKIHDSITGPVEDFAPLNYTESKPGETFIKIGIGVLKRTEEQAYRFSNPYELLDTGKWSVRTGSDFVEYRHELSDPKSGFAYIYTKTVRLTPGKPQMTIEHNIKNTGTKAIATNVYNHGFFMLDSQPTGPGFTVTFPFDIKISRELNGMAEVRGKQIVYLQELAERTPAPVGGAPGAVQSRGGVQGGAPGAARGGAPGGGRQTVSTLIEGFSTTDPKDFDIRVENQKTRAGVRITGDRPLFRINFWSIRTTVCPEAYVEVKADPDKDFSWKLTYDFYTLPQGGAAW
jgi:hypothetical protein